MVYQTSPSILTKRASLLLETFYLRDMGFFVDVVSGSRLAGQLGQPQRGMVKAADFDRTIEKKGRKFRHANMENYFIVKYMLDM